MRYIHRNKIHPVFNVFHLSRFVYILFLKIFFAMYFSRLVSRLLRRLPVQRAGFDPRQRL